ncbi:uncharacterized protein KQ657_004646 [Scheffersomyces spartinae]|uniref:Uncharacterized protein n=1 Tax=Scheffersomyces spartinae TaxID=45513 RepID=A0A9P7VAX0_9ASCO|nr:uncharacterized protein KQ657_004646 [Scheffersomyces spartinae]KAG7194433.1 hypothetical protein KQ657_004646 [Scheffersomyces spartinae]
MMRKVMPAMYKDVVNDMPNYGEQFDERSMWLAKQETKTPKSSVIVYLHGGGYFLQTQPMQLAMICTLYKLVNKATRSNLNILFLDYKLVSEGEYPLPYQVVELYKTYVNLVNAGYEDIQLLGDSAGGNIAICFTQYLYMLYNKLPDSNINTTLEISKQIYPSELILVSPWVKLLPEIADIYTPGKSWHDNEKYDIITHNLGESIKHIVKTAKLDHLLVSPGNAKAEVEDWLRIPLFSDPKLRLFVLFGEDESFRDDIIDWCENALGVPSETFAAKNRQYSYTKFDKSKSKCQVEIHMEPYGIHDSLFFFEDDAAIALRQKKPLDINKYYGLTRVVDFVNRHFE